jgi:hypothetical protein
MVIISPWYRRKAESWETWGLSVDKESHPVLLTLAECLMTYNSFLWPMASKLMEDNNPSLTIQGQELSTQHVGGIDDTQPSLWKLMTH